MRCHAPAGPLVVSPGVTWLAGCKGARFFFWGVPQIPRTRCGCRSLCGCFRFGYIPRPSRRSSNRFPDCCACLPSVICLYAVAVSPSACQYCRACALQSKIATSAGLRTRFFAPLVFVCSVTACAPARLYSFQALSFAAMSSARVSIRLSKNGLYVPASIQYPLITCCHASLFIRLSSFLCAAGEKFPRKCPVYIRPCRPRFPAVFLSWRLGAGVCTKKGRARFPRSADRKDILLYSLVCQCPQYIHKRLAGLK